MNSRNINNYHLIFLHPYIIHDGLDFQTFQTKFSMYMKDLQLNSETVFFPCNIDSQIWLNSWTLQTKVVFNFLHLQNKELTT